MTLLRPIIDWLFPPVRECDATINDQCCCPETEARIDSLIAELDRDRQALCRGLGIESVSELAKRFRPPTERA